MSEEQKNDTIETIQKDLNKAVNRRKWSTIRQRAMPIIALPVAVSAGLFTGLAGSWEHLTPLAQKIAVMGSAGIFAATTAFSTMKPLFNKSASPFVSKRDAARLIDKDINEGINPAQTLLSDISEHNPQGANQIWKLELKRIWREWSDPIQNQKFELGHAPYYTKNKTRALLHGGAVAASIAAASLTNVTFNDFETAWMYEPPPPKLLYTAWVTPPDGVPEAPLYQDSMLDAALEDGENTSLAAHEGSVFSIITYERQGEIRVNGEVINPDTTDAGNAVSQTQEISEFSYTIPLDDNEVSISIEGVDFVFSVTPDNAPDIDIISTQTSEASPNNVTIEYTIEDDYGVTDAELSIGITDENGRTIRPLAPSVSIPEILIPFSDRPDLP